ncbi:unnamed protein product, partial [Amoebophrya sp. A120]
VKKQSGAPRSVRRALLPCPARCAPIMGWAGGSVLPLLAPGQHSHRDRAVVFMGGRRSSPTTDRRTQRAAGLARTRRPPRTGEPSPPPLRRRPPRRAAVAPLRPRPRPRALRNADNRNRPVCRRGRRGAARVGAAIFYRFAFGFCLSRRSANKL